MHSLLDWMRYESLIWRFPLYNGGVQPIGNLEFEPPETWMRSLDAVARDLKCFRVGREVTLDRLVWEFEVNSDYYVGIGWGSVDSIGGFNCGEGMSMDAPYADAAAWVAETVQTELAGYEFVQWPRKGRHLLSAQAGKTGAKWVDRMMEPSSPISDPSAADGKSHIRSRQRIAGRCAYATALPTRPSTYSKRAVLHG